MRIQRTFYENILQNIGIPKLWVRKQFIGIWAILWDNIRDSNNHGKWWGEPGHAKASNMESSTRLAIPVRLWLAALSYLHEPDLMLIMYIFQNLNVLQPTNQSPVLSSPYNVRNQSMDVVLMELLLLWVQNMLVVPLYVYATNSALSKRLVIQSLRNVNVDQE